MLRETIAFLELAALWVFLGLRYRALPALIHSPFNGGGDAHGMGSKDQLWLLLLLASIFYVFLTALARLPLPINVPTGTSQATIDSIRRQIPQLLGALKLSVLALVLWMTYVARQFPPPAQRSLTTLGFLLFVFASALVPLARMMTQLRRTADRTS